MDPSGMQAERNDLRDAIVGAFGEGESLSVDEAAAAMPLEERTDLNFVPPLSSRGHPTRSRCEGCHPLGC
jgi:hypothetical protein